MLSKRLNLACTAPFRYLHEGTIFNVEVATLCTDVDQAPIRNVEHYWLCRNCVTRLKVVVEKAK